MKWINLCNTALLALSATVAHAQKPGGPAKPTPARTAAEIPVFLGTLPGGIISDRAFDSLLTSRLSAKDPRGGVAKVTGFSVTFAERGIYEDSSGNPLVAVDYYTEACTGDTLSALLRATLPERTKPGDTVWFDRIGVATAASQAAGKTMKFVIGR